MNVETEQMSFCTVTATLRIQGAYDLGSAELYSTDHHTQQGFMSCHVMSGIYQMVSGGVCWF